MVFEVGNVWACQPEQTKAGGDARWSALRPGRLSLLFCTGKELTFLHWQRVYVPACNLWGVSPLRGRSCTSLLLGYIAHSVTMSAFYLQVFNFMVQFLDCYAAESYRLYRWTPADLAAAAAGLSRLASQEQPGMLLHHATVRLIDDGLLAGGKLAPAGVITVLTVSLRKRNTNPDSDTIMAC